MRQTLGDSWIGGDIAGLQAMGNTMKPAPDEIKDVVRELASQADKLVGDAGWSGGAANNFQKAWATNAIQAGGLADVVGKVGTTIGDLGDKLAQVEADLYNAADVAQGRGAQIGPTGVPLPLIVTGDANAPTAAAAVQAQQDYTAAYNYAKHTAQGYRLHAADVLQGVADSVAPTKDPLKWDQRVTVADYLKGLWVIPNETARIDGKNIPDKIADAEERLKDSRARGSKPATTMRHEASNSRKLIPHNWNGLAR